MEYLRDAAHAFCLQHIALNVGSQTEVFVLFHFLAFHKFRKQVIVIYQRRHVHSETSILGCYFQEIVKNVYILRDAHKCKYSNIQVQNRDHHIREEDWVRFLGLSTSHFVESFASYWTLTDHGSNLWASALEGWLGHFPISTFGVLTWSGSISCVLCSAILCSQIANGRLFQFSREIVIFCSFTLQ